MKNVSLKLNQVLVKNNSENYLKRTSTSVNVSAMKDVTGSVIYNARWVKDNTGKEDVKSAIATSIITVDRSHEENKRISLETLTRLYGVAASQSYLNAENNTEEISLSVTSGRMDIINESVVLNDTKIESNVDALREAQKEAIRVSSKGYYKLVAKSKRHEGDILTQMCDDAEELLRVFSNTNFQKNTDGDFMNEPDDMVEVSYLDTDRGISAYISAHNMRAWALPDDAGDGVSALIILQGLKERFESAPKTLH